ncbi:MAG: tRNA (adenosine(37)-N6)-threonylcarbamoyltransferase complex ATPase subunit type 1 TsaE [Mogibacterium sp.]|nr:tRNA (adenosine(37)-N6)-threonylcarbamoyltransferase complex ATPase subunit type 1 TsaE [Mogibacterium sp.]
MRKDLRDRLLSKPWILSEDRPGEELTLRIASELETRILGLELSSCAEPGDVIALIGDLGTGKTTLTQYIAEGLGIREQVISPTFTLVREYHSGRLPLYHFDAYRLSCGEDLYEIGGDEYLYGEGICVVEWADLVLDALPEDSLVIRITYGKQEGERIYQCIF